MQRDVAVVGLQIIVLLAVEEAILLRSTAAVVAFAVVAIRQPLVAVVPVDVDRNFGLVLVVGLGLHVIPQYKVFRPRDLILVRRVLVRILLDPDRALGSLLYGETLELVVAQFVIAIDLGRRFALGPQGMAALVFHPSAQIVRRRQAQINVPANAVALHHVELAVMKGVQFRLIFQLVQRQQVVAIVEQLAVFAVEKMRGGSRCESKVQR